VPERMTRMARCIRDRDFEAFGQLTMQDSNQFHATCLDTFPPIFYLNDISQRIIALVHRFNAHHGRTKVGPPPHGPVPLAPCTSHCIPVPRWPTPLMLAPTRSSSCWRTRWMSSWRW